MRFISEKEYNNRMKQIKLKNESIKREKRLKKEANKYKEKIKLPSASKLILFSMILLCTQIVLFAEYIMLKFGDMSALYALIGIPVALAPIIWGYYSKSKAENTSGGIVYDMAMGQINGDETNVNETNNEDYIDDFIVG